jgi:hypothetical protein
MVRLQSVVTTARSGETNIAGANRLVKRGKFLYQQEMFKIIFCAAL